MAHTVAVIPAHNEALTIRDIVAATSHLVDAVIVIDDGSTDGTSDALSGLDVRLVRHTRNAGKGERLAEGVEAAFEDGATQVLTLDADGQHDPLNIPAFLACAKEHPGTFILGDRSADFGNMPRSRALGNGLGSFFVAWACARKLRDAQCGMRMYPLDVWRSIHVPSKYIDGFLFETAVLLYAADADVTFATIPIASRYDGYVQRPSHFNPVSDFLKIAALVTRFLFSHRLRLSGLFIAFGLAADLRTRAHRSIKPCQN